jgi:hypothetical protein
MKSNEERLSLLEKQINHIIDRLLELEEKYKPRIDRVNDMIYLFFEQA